MTCFHTDFSQGKICGRLEWKKREYLLNGLHSDHRTSIFGIPSKFRFRWYIHVHIRNFHIWLVQVTCVANFASIMKMWDRVAVSSCYNFTICSYCWLVLLFTATYCTLFLLFAATTADQFYHLQLILACFTIYRYLLHPIFAIYSYD